MTTGNFLAIVSLLICLACSVYLYKLWKDKIALMGSFFLLFLSAFSVASCFSPQMLQLLPAIAITISLASLIAFWSIFRYKLFSSFPITHNLIMDNALEGIIIVDRFGKVAEKNNAVSGFINEVTGNDKDASGMLIEELFGTWPRWLTACKNFSFDEFDIETSRLGEPRYYHVKIYPLTNKRSKKQGTMSILFDITENKNQVNQLLLDKKCNKEQVLKLAGELYIQKKQLESIIENMSDHCMVVDGNGQYIQVNKAAREILLDIKLKKVGDWLQRARCFDIHGNGILADALPAARVMRGETLADDRLIFKDHAKEIHFDMNGAPVYDQQGHFLFGVILGRDVTERVKREKEMLLQKEQLETIINTMSDLSILSIVDKEGKFLHWSNGANNYFSQEVFEQKAGNSYAKGTFYYENGIEIEYHDMPVFRVLRGDILKNFHYFMKTQKGEIHFLINGTPVYNKQGELVYGVVFNLDITEQVHNKLLVPALEKLEIRNQLKDKLFTVISHDIRDPFAAMVNVIELLELEESYNADMVEIIHTVKEYAYNIYGMVENLLEWVKSQREGLIRNPSSVHLSGLFQEVLKVYQLKSEAKGITFINQIDDYTFVFVDKYMLQLVLQNLLSNATKFSKNGGQIMLGAKVSGENVILSVSDTGIGIEPEKIKFFFDDRTIISKLGTAGEKGVGLGLLLCKDFVHLNGGEIWLESILGQGSTFYVKLPAASNS